MTARLLRPPVLGAVLVLALSPSALAADPPPKGAKARLGTTRLRDPNGWGGAALTADGKYLVHYGSKGLTRFDVATGEPAGSVGGPKGGGFGGGRAELTADGKRGLTVNYVGVTVWEAGSGKVLAEVKRPMPYGESGAAVSADGAVLAVGGAKDDRAKDKPVTALVWDVGRNARRAEVTVLQNQYANVALSPAGTVLATWGTHYEPNPPKEGIDPATDPNRIVQFWDAVTGKELSRLRTDGFGSAVVAFSPDGQTAAVGHGNGAIRLVDPRTGAERRRLFARSDQGTRLAFSPDGKTLASAGGDGVVQLWGAADGARVGLVECPVGPLPAGVRGMEFAAAGRLVAWAVVGSAAFVWEVPSGKLLSPHAGHASTVQSVVFAAGGKEVLTGGADGRLLRWEAATGKELGEVLLRLPGGSGAPSQFRVLSVEVTADGKTATAGRGSQGVFDLATGRQVAAPTTGMNYDLRSYLCPDARTLLTVPNVPFPPKPRPAALKVPVWDTATGAKATEIETPVGDLSAAAVTPDRTKLVTAVTTNPAGDAKAAFLVTAWDLATGRKLGELSQPGGTGMTYLTPAPDNKSALVSGPDGKVVVVDLATGKAAREIDTTNQRATAAPAFGPGGKQFAVALGTGFGAGAGATARVYDWESGKVVGAVQGHAAPVSCLAFSPDGKTLATGSQDTTVLLWDLAALGKE